MSGGVFVSGSDEAIIFFDVVLDLAYAVPNPVEGAADPHDDSYFNADEVGGQVQTPIA